MPLRWTPSEDSTPYPLNLLTDSGGTCQPAWAYTTFTVNPDADTDDNACTAVPNGCTLREAINAANAEPSGNDEIVFDLGQTATITLATYGCSLPNITGASGLTIGGQSASITISVSNRAEGVFSVGGRGASGVKLTLNSLTVANGFACSEGAGGISNYGTTTVSNSTLSGNGVSFATDGGGILNYGPVTMENTILANSPCGGTLTDGGHNLDPGTSCGFGTENNSLSGVDPRLGPLADSGGPTQTHALPEGSLAVDKGASFGATSDQRGEPRPSNFANIENPGNGSDIGAFELQATDHTAPRVSRVEPRDNATGIRPGTNVRAFFSEAMMKVSINTTTFKLFKVLGKDSALDATVIYHGATNRAMLDPSADLRRGDSYRVVVTTGAKDVARNRLDRDPSNGH